MSAVILTDICCDVCDAPFNPDGRTIGAKIGDIRELARKRGWTSYARHGETLKDYCDKCRPSNNPATRKRRVGNNGNSRAGASI